MSTKKRMGRIEDRPLVGTWFVVYDGEHVDDQGGVYEDGCAVAIEWDDRKAYLLFSSGGHADDFLPGVCEKYGFDRLSIRLIPINEELEDWVVREAAARDIDLLVDPAPNEAGFHALRLIPGLDKVPIRSRERALRPSVGARSMRRR